MHTHACENMICETYFVSSKHFTPDPMVSVYVYGQASVRTSMFYCNLPA